MATNFALHVSCFSILINLILAIAAILIGASSSNCAFAVDCGLDVVSSMILLWRFYDENKSCAKVIERRERIACIGLGIMFIISGAVVITKSIVDLTFQAFSSSSVSFICIAIYLNINCHR